MSEDGQMIFGDLGGLKLPDICLTVRKNPEKTSTRKLVPTTDRTRARCVTGAHATACPIAVDVKRLRTLILIKELCSDFKNLLLRAVLIDFTNSSLRFLIPSPADLCNWAKITNYVSNYYQQDYKYPHLSIN